MFDRVQCCVLIVFSEMPIGGFNNNVTNISFYVFQLENLDQGVAKGGTGSAPNLACL